MRNPPTNQSNPFNEDRFVIIKEKQSGIINEDLNVEKTPCGVLAEDVVILSIKSLLKKNVISQKDGFEFILNNIDEINRSETGVGSVADPNGITLLHALVICSWLSNFEKTLLVDRILKVKGVNINSMDNLKKTALHYALLKRENIKNVKVYHKYILVRRLLDVPGIDVTIKDHKGLTPLLIAAKNMNTISLDKVILFEKLLSVLFNNLRDGKDIHINAVDEEKKSILHHILYKFQKNSKRSFANFTMLRLVLQHNDLLIAEQEEKLENISDKLSRQKSNATKLESLQEQKTIVENYLKKLQMTKYSIDVNLKDKSDKAPLHIAASLQNIVAVKLLVRHKHINLNIQDKVGKTAFHYCSLTKDSSMMDVLLKQEGLAVTVQDKLGKTALHNCIEAGSSIRFVRDILQFGPDVVTLRDKRNVSCLDLAKKKRKEEIVQLLEERIKNVFPQDLNNFSQLMRIIQEGDLPQLENLLKDHPEFLKAKDHEDKNCLHHLARVPITDHHKDIVSYLLKKIDDTEGVNINDVDKSTKKTALHYACASDTGCTCFIRLLVKHNIDVNAEDFHKKTALHYACQGNERSENAMALLQYDVVDVNKVDQMGKTPLHHAVEKSKVDIISTLVEKTTNINAQDKLGKMALHYAVERNNSTEEIMRVMLGKQDVALNLQDHSRKTVLHHALKREKCSEEIVKQLLSNERISIHHVDEDGRSVLHYCGIMGHPQYIIEKILSRHNVDEWLKHQDNFERSAIDYARINNHIHVIDYLKEAMSLEAAPNIQLTVEDLTYKEIKRLNELNAKLHGELCWKQLCRRLKKNGRVDFSEFNIKALANPHCAILGESLFQNFNSFNPCLTTKKFLEVVDENDVVDVCNLLQKYLHIKFVSDLPSEIKFQLGVLCCDSQDWMVIAECCGISKRAIDSMNNMNSSRTSENQVTYEMFQVIKMFSPGLTLRTLEKNLRQCNLIQLAVTMGEIISHKKGRNISR